MIESKELTRAIAGYILDGENIPEVKNELKRYKAEFPEVLDYNWYMYGNILPYYSDIRNFYTKNGFEPGKDTDKLLQNFRYHIRKAIDLILSE